MNTFAALNLPAIDQLATQQLILIGAIAVFLAIGTYVLTSMLLSGRRSRVRRKERALPDQGDEAVLTVEGTDDEPTDEDVVVSEATDRVAAEEQAAEEQAAEDQVEEPVAASSEFNAGKRSLWQRLFGSRSKAEQPDDVAASSEISEAESPEVQDVTKPPFDAPAPAPAAADPEPVGVDVWQDDEQPAAVEDDEQPVELADDEPAVHVPWWRRLFGLGPKVPAVQQLPEEEQFGDELFEDDTVVEDEDAFFDEEPLVAATPDEDADDDVQVAAETVEVADELKSRALALQAEADGLAAELVRLEDLRDELRAALVDVDVRIDHLLDRAGQLQADTVTETSVFDQLTAEPADDTFADAGAVEGAADTIGSADGSEDAEDAEGVPPVATTSGGISVNLLPTPDETSDVEVDPHTDLGHLAHEDQFSNEDDGDDTEVAEELADDSWNFDADDSWEDSPEPVVDEWDVTAEPSDDDTWDDDTWDDTEHVDETWDDEQPAAVEDDEQPVELADDEPAVHVPWWRRLFGLGPKDPSVEPTASDVPHDADEPAAEDTDVAGDEGFDDLELAATDLAAMPPPSADDLLHGRDAPDDDTLQDLPAPDTTEETSDLQDDLPAPDVELDPHTDLGHLAHEDQFSNEDDEDEAAGDLSDTSDQLQDDPLDGWQEPVAEDPDVLEPEVDPAVEHFAALSDGEPVEPDAPTPETSEQPAVADATDVEDSGEATAEQEVEEPPATPAERARALQGTLPSSWSARQHLDEKKSGNRLTNWFKNLFSSSSDTPATPEPPVAEPPVAEPLPEQPPATQHEDAPDPEVDSHENLAGDLDAEVHEDWVDDPESVDPHDDAASEDTWNFDTDDSDLGEPELDDPEFDEQEPMWDIGDEPDVVTQDTEPADVEEPVDVDQSDASPVWDVATDDSTWEFPTDDTTDAPPEDSSWELPEAEADEAEDAAPVWNLDDSDEGDLGEPEGSSTWDVDQSPSESDDVWDFSTFDDTDDTAVEDDPTAEDVTWNLDEEPGDDLSENELTEDWDIAASGPDEPTADADDPADTSQSADGDDSFGDDVWDFSTFDDTDDDTEADDDSEFLVEEPHEEFFEEDTSEDVDSWDQGWDDDLDSDNDVLLDEPDLDDEPESDLHADLTSWDDPSSTDDSQLTPDSLVGPADPDPDWHAMPSPETQAAEPGAAPVEAADGDDTPAAPGWSPVEGYAADDDGSPADHRDYGLPEPLPHRSDG